MNSSNILNKEKQNLNEVKLTNNLSIHHLENIKSKLILKTIFNKINKVKLFNIIRFNKKIQNKIGINIKDYQNYSENYTPIKIEIIPKENKYGTFIKIPFKDKSYYHIYINDSKKEEDKNSINEHDKITKIKVIIEHQVKSLNELFKYCEIIESINFRLFARNNINNMRHMFWGCISLKKLNISNFNTINVTDMNGMFFGCSSIKKLDLSKFNTNKVTDMNSMFRDCSSLTELDLSRFNMNNVTDISFMFFGCSSLEKLNLTINKNNQIINDRYMFNGCYKLKEN